MRIHVKLSTPRLSSIDTEVVHHFFGPEPTRVRIRAHSKQCSAMAEEKADVALAQRRSCPYRTVGQLPQLPLWLLHYTPVFSGNPPELRLPLTSPVGGYPPLVLSRPA